MLFLEKTLGQRILSLALWGLFSLTLCVFLFGWQPVLSRRCSQAAQPYIFARQPDGHSSLQFIHSLAA